MSTTKKYPTQEEFQNYLDKSLTFEQYYEKFSSAVERVKNDDLEGLVYPQYFVINLQRLKRGVKTTKLSEGLSSAIKDLDKKISW